MRVAVCFSRQGSAALVSHLDLHRSIARVLRRSGLPISFSEGYNPHPILSFALPLPVGLSTDEAYFEMALVQTLPEQQILDALAPQMPQGLSVLKVYAIPQEAPSLMPRVKSAEYRVTFQDIAQGNFVASRLEDIFAQECFLLRKHTKSGNKNIDVRPMFLGLQVENQEIFLHLTAGNQGGLNPRLLLDAVLLDLDLDAQYTLHLTRLWGEIHGEKVSVMEAGA